MVLLFLLVSCSPRSEETTHSFRIYEEDGVTIAENKGGSKYTGNIFTYEPVLRLHQDPENEESLLFGPSEFSMDQEGNYYVLDSRNYRIAVFNQRGEYLRTFGREGQGPGEFTMMTNLLIRGDVVSVYDYRLRRRTFYRTDGTLIKVVTVPTTVKGISFGSMWDLQVLDNDRFFLLKWENRSMGDAEFFRAGISIIRHSSSPVRYEVSRCLHPFESDLLSPFWRVRGFSGCS